MAPLTESMFPTSTRMVTDRFFCFFYLEKRLFSAKSNC